MEYALSDLFSLAQAVEHLRRARRPRHAQSLRDRIRRGTLTGVRIGQQWYVPRREIEQLAQQPYHRQGGRPRLAPALQYARLEYADPGEVLRDATLPRATRIRAMLNAQAFWFGILRARLQRQHPNLSKRDLVLAMFAELERG